MQEQNTRQDKYIDYLNKSILPKINFKRLQASYDGDREYAKEVLRDLHNAVEKCYGTSSFDYGSCQDSEGFITIPGIVHGQNTGKIAVVLLDLDLDSSGEHYGTNFLLDVGVVEQFPDNKALADRVERDFIPYDYCYTPLVLNDIHIDFDTLPQDLKEMLETFQDSGQQQGWERFDKAKHKAAEAKTVTIPKVSKQKKEKEI
jgi:hypothetical protein